MRVLFLGGGTGGHLVPGIAVAEELRRRGHESLFLIAGRDVEQDLLKTRSLPRAALFGNHSRPSLLHVPRWTRATLRWRTAVREYDPDVIVVLGGWVALPAVLTGFFGRPSVLIESNARPGKVLRLLATRIEHSCLVADGRGMPRGRLGTHLTGHPLPAMPRRERARAARALGLDPERRTLLLFGGSQGAHDLNSLGPRLATVLSATDEPWQIYNITGRQGIAVRTDPDEAGQHAGQDADVPIHRAEFEEDMASAYSVADVAVTRAGAGTVAELAQTGTPAILVPYPHHSDRHQEANGRRLVDVGAALMVSRDDPTGRRTAPSLLREALDRLPAMSASGQRLSRPAATSQVTDVVLSAAAVG